MTIDNVEKADHQMLIQIWEASVRATHYFLTENELQQLKPLILEQYFDAVELRCAKTPEGEIVGFCGVLDGNIEMLFVLPKVIGKGIGSLLTRHAIEAQRATTVDVNEQNSQARAFYQRMGFSVMARSPLDGQRKPYPLLHMELRQR